MTRGLVLAWLALTVPSTGCTDVLIGYADLEQAPPYRVIVYAGATELTVTDAQNSSPPDEGGPWVTEAHRFEMPPGSSNLTLRVTVDLALSEPVAEERVQSVHVNATGPGGLHHDATFETSGQRTWNHTGPVDGTWTVAVEGRGRGEVGISAAVRNDGSGL